MISIIIPTKNRAEALEKISLPSLVNQTYKEFEVIIWDASDNEGVLRVIENFPELNIKYFKAPRIGTSSQRNDAINRASGEIYYFIDDDTELSNDALEAILEEFSSSNDEVVGCSPPLISSNVYEGPFLKRISSFIWKPFTLIFCLPYQSHYRIVKRSGAPCWPAKDSPGLVQWLQGCSMAFKKEAFKIRSFDERLQNLGPYAKAEDVVFSYGLFKQGKKLLITRKGWAKHHFAPGGRPQSETLHASALFSIYFIWRSLIWPENPCSVVCFFLFLFGFFLQSLLLSIFRRNLWRLKGFFIGLKAIRSSELARRTTMDQTMKNRE